MSETLSPEATALTVEAVASALKIFRKSYPDWITDDDAHGEMWLWAVSHVRRVEDLAESYNDGHKGIAFSRLRAELIDAASRMAEREKASWGGYDPKDVAFYKPEQVFAALRVWAEGVTSEAGQVSDGPKPTTDPAEGGNLLVSILDARSAWDKAPLTADEQRAVAVVKIHGYTLDQAAEALDTTVAVVRNLVRKAGWKLVRELGGRDPWSQIDEKLRERP